MKPKAATEKCLKIFMLDNPRESGICETRLPLKSGAAKGQETGLAKSLHEKQLDLKFLHYTFRQTPGFYSLKMKVDSDSRHNRGRV